MQKNFLGKRFKNSMKKIFNFLLSNYFKKKTFMMGQSHILNMRKNYDTITSIADIDYKVFSQHGEDGIIDFLLKKLNIEKPKFIEIGVGDYTECNTRFLFESRSAKGLIIDCLKDLKSEVTKNLKLWKGDLKIDEIYINSENVTKILKKHNFENDIDFFSLDIDGIDYWIIKSLPSNFSKVAVIEYNPVFGYLHEITVPNINEFNRKSYHYSNLCYGVSLRALIKIMESKNFYFLGTNLRRNNAFFVSKDYKKEVFFPKIQISNISQNTDCNVRESRGLDGKLTFLSGNDRIKEIKECEVIDLKQNLKIKIKDLFDI